MQRITITVLLVFILTSTFANAQEGQGTGKPEPKKPKPNPAFAEVIDDPALPRVLLIGDSISIGYTVPVQEMLKGKANVHRIPTNGGPTTNGLKHIEQWLGDKPWDVIHFNWGLHDLKYIDDKGALVDVEQGHQQVPIEEYEQNLRTLVERLQKTEAKLIWRSTTPVPEGATGRVVGDSAKYNAVAAAIMQEHGIPTDDQYAFALSRLEEIQRPANVHFTEEGSRQLAAQAVAAIQQALNNN
ncbi:MAG: SGNH/GDSL hydrolase family protein [Planctomycetaceae bacterium]|nr:SGNH/GDSL hydrolase family protein [Planctomycetaceae bacterium]